MSVKKVRYQRKNSPMLTIEDLNKISNTNLKIDAVNKRLDALGHMLTNSSDMKKLVPQYAGFTYDESMDITTIFQTEDTTVTFGIWHKKDTLYPTHCHEKSVEFLICIKGSFTLVYNDIIQIIKKGDCTPVPMGVTHMCTSLEDESEMLAICIPPEKAYVQCGEK